MDFDALAHRLTAQQMYDAVGHAAVGHTLDAETVGGGGAGDGGKDSAADGDLAVLGLNSDHISFPFCVVL